MWVYIYCRLSVNLDSKFGIRNRDSDSDQCSIPCVNLLQEKSWNGFQYIGTCERNTSSWNLVLRCLLSAVWAAVSVVIVDDHNGCPRCSQTVLKIRLRCLRFILPVVGLVINGYLLALFRIYWITFPVSSYVEFYVPSVYFEFLI